MIFKNKAQAKRDTGICYLGKVEQTVKHKKAKKYNEATYTLYLAPAKTSGYEVCPGRTKECTKLCLHESGMNKMNMRNDRINRAHIAKTKLFFEDRQFFMDWLIYEIKSAKRIAEKNGQTFSVRLNNTSDISPEDFYIFVHCEKINILQYFNDVMFYDYTKVYDRIELVEKYKNYHITFSFSGFNYSNCVKVLQSGKNVAMVFKTVPTSYHGYKVINGDLYDMRYKDEQGVIVGLKYKETRTKLPAGTKFVIQ